MRLLRRTALIAASAVTLAGCGGQTATKADVIARGDAICANALRAVRATTPPAGGTPAELSDYLQRVLPIVDQEVGGLSALPRPARDRVLLNRYIAAVTALGSDYRRLAAAARRADETATAQALATLRSSPAALLAQRYGLIQCSASAGTGAS